MRNLLILTLILLAGCAPALAQPGMAPPPPAANGLDVPALLKLTDGAINGMCDELLASTRLEKIKAEGLIVAPPWTNVEEKKDDWVKGIVMLVQEKLTTAMIRQDKETRFEVVDRAKIDAAMKELRLNADALRDPRVWPELGKATGAKYMLTGSMIIIPMREAPLTIVFTFTSRIVDLETGRALSASGADFVFSNGPANPAGAR